MTDELTLRLAEPADAPRMLEVIHASFAARPPVDPPAAALSDTVEQIERGITAGQGVIAQLHGQIVGCLLLSERDGRAWLSRVSVLPDIRRHGVAEAMVRGAVELATDLGRREMELLARREFPETRVWWERHGFRQAGDAATGWIMRLDLPVRVDVPTSDDMQALGAALADVLRAGDVVIASGDLGAGKTTLTQGLGAGLQVDRPVISPTFVLSRVHPSLVGGPDLVHVDAYRLGSAAELEDLDLDASLTDSVTLVEWGAGLAEGLAASRLEIDIRRSGDPDDETRIVYLTGVGERWHGVPLPTGVGAEKEASR